MPAVPAPLKQTTVDSQRRLKSIYFNPTHPAGFTGNAAVLARAARLPLEQTRKWLEAEPTYTLHKAARRRFSTRPYRVGTVDQQWQADLVEMQPYARANQGNRYLLTVIDLFSRYGWAEPLHNKTAKEVAGALERIFQSSGRHPLLLQTDQGKEFENIPMRQMLARYHSRQFAVKSPFKAAIVERFNRTLKTKMWRAFTHQNNYNYLEVLPRLLTAYNQSPHRGLGGRTPAQVVSGPEEQVEVWQEQNPAKEQSSRPRFQVGDRVRLALQKGPFKKGYVPNWTEEVFHVKEVRTFTQPITYKVEDEQGELLEGSFYTEELQRVVPPQLYRIERIVRWWTSKKDGSRMALVKWLGFPASKNSWVPEADIQTV